MENIQHQECFELFKKDLNGFVKTSITKNFPEVAVMTDCTMEPEQAEPLVYVDNADPNVKGAFAMASKIREYLKGVAWSMPDDFHVKVVTKFKKRDEKLSEDKKQEGAKDDGLPEFFPTKPRYTFSQVILPETVKKSIFSALGTIERKELIYETWGFGQVDSIPKSVINLYGPPGTGKTMCAHAISNHLGKPLLALNYSEIESKYVGDAAKNLKKAFDTAKNTDAILFFDEADSFLGKRIENVRQGSDQALNSLRSQMLILLEEHSGVVLFATNLVTNFDSAFTSRILAHIKLELPNREARADIIKKGIPSKLPLDRPFTDEEFLETSDLIDGLAGREIKNALLDMLTTKANECGADAVFTIDDLKAAMIRKKESIAALKAEENLILKEKITRKLTEKGMEEAAIQEAKENKSEGNATETETPSV